MLNVVASSTKEVGLGHRHDTLEDLIGDSNWKKVVGLGMHLSTHYFANFWLIRWQGERVLQKIIKAVPERNDHQDDLWEFKKSLSEHYGTQLSKWQADFEAWEKDRSSYKNPFKVRSHGTSSLSHDPIPRTESKLASHHSSFGPLATSSRGSQLVGNFGTHPF